MTIDPNPQGMSCLLIAGPWRGGRDRCRTLWWRASYVITNQLASTL